MYEQDYIIRMNNEVIRTMVKLLLNKDTGVPVNISEGIIKSENKKMLEAANGQSGIDNIKKMEEEILTLVERRSFRKSACILWISKWTDGRCIIVEEL